MTLFDSLEPLTLRPAPFAYYTSPQFWNDPHISKGMLEAHLDPDRDAASFRRDFIDTSIDWMTSRFHIWKTMKICDFGCGPGLWTTRFAERGARVTGVDLSERSIRYARDTAREKHLEINYVLQDYLQFTTEDRFDLITMIYGDFSVLSPAQRTTLLRTFHTLLDDDGFLFLDVASMERFYGATEHIEYEYSPADGFWCTGSHHVFSSRFKYEQESLLCDRYTVIGRDREFEVYTWDQSYSMKSLNEMFDASGFRIVSCYSDVAGTPLTDESRDITVVAKKMSEEG